MEEVLTESEVVVIGNKSPEFEDIYRLVNDKQIIIDLVRIIKDKDNLESNYQGICW
jgi:hypothetical protein